MKCATPHPVEVQVATLRLIGTSLYPAVDSLLKTAGIEQKLLRYRSLPLPLLLIPRMF